MDLFDSHSLDLLYSFPHRNAPSSKDAKFNGGSFNYEDFKNMVDGYVPPNRIIGADPKEVLSPISHRTHNLDVSGRIQVHGNKCKIDSNIPTYQNMALYNDWTRAPKEYKCVNGKIKKVNSRKYVPPVREKGDINGMSRDSRRRLLKTVNKIDHKNRRLPFWITLTYPQRFPTDSEEYKADLDTLLKRVKRAFGEIEYLWRLEFQKRGAPHYHIILFLPKWKGKIQYLRKWISKNWYEVAQRFWNQKDEKHLRAGTNCKRIKNYRQLVSYVSKYMGKIKDKDIPHTGRVWAASKNWGDHIADVVIVGDRLIRFIRVIRNYIRSQGSQRMSKYMASNPNTDVFVHWEVVMQALEWLDR